MNMSNEELKEELERQSKAEQSYHGMKTAKDKQPKGAKQRT